MPTDTVAELVISAFKALPAKAKPRVHDDGRCEWTTLSGIVLSKDGAGPECVSMGTGLRCLPAAKLPSARGRCLHDWHAEIVAMRAFNTFLLDECARLASQPETTAASDWIDRIMPEAMAADSQQPFAIKDDVAIHMYSSEAPCGDASMELVMQAQADPTPWTSVPPVEEYMLDGRGFFSKLGVVRRKPARGDAPPTYSKSCSDKLALKQCTSLLSSLTCLLIHPSNAYLKTLVLPRSQYVHLSIERCFGLSGRLSSLVTQGNHIKSWTAGYCFRPFDVQTTGSGFDYSKAATSSAGQSSGSNITACWTPGHFEVLISGTRSGFKQFSGRGQSVISRVSQWKQCLRIARSLKMASIAKCLSQETYDLVKEDELLEARRSVKAEAKSGALQGWTRNGGDNSFGLEDSEAAYIASISRE